MEQRVRREGGVEPFIALLQDVRIFLMSSDMAGIYNNRRKLTRLAVAHAALLPSYRSRVSEGMLGTLDASKNISQDLRKNTSNFHSDA